MNHFSFKHVAALLAVFVVPVLMGAEGGCGGDVSVGSDEPCVETGCSGQICADEDMASTCEWNDSYACYQDGICERDASGVCGWRQTEELVACLDDPQPDPCLVTGCSGEICAGEEMASDCSWDETYACYDDGICERDASGTCGWRQTEELVACLEDPQPEPCLITGCSGEICAGEEMASNCPWDETYACYEDGICERDASGTCGWRQTEELVECLEDPRTPVTGACIKNAGDACSTDADCDTGGCGGELCFNPALSGGVSDCDCTAPPIDCGCVNGACSWYE